METNEIVKALRVCAAAGSCADCPCYQAGERCARKDTEAANLIEKQAVEIQALRGAANSLKAALSAMEKDLWGGRIRSGRLPILRSLLQRRKAGIPA